MLGTRESDIYGQVTLADIEQNCREESARLGYELVFAQTNHEGELVELIQSAGQSAAGIIINPAAYTHTSVAIHDAIRAINIPVVEVHLSNIFARETFRHHSYVSPVALGTICGFGPAGYILALGALTSHIPD